MKAVLGLDLGTSGLKGVILDERGQKLADARAGYPLRVPQPGWTEQDPRD
ncbi:FGGY family carbohydrate kinase, partial [Thermus antranikianii]